MINGSSIPKETMVPIILNGMSRSYERVIQVIVALESFFLENRAREVVLRGGRLKVGIAFVGII